MVPPSLRALAELCDWISAANNCITVLNLREVMRDELPPDVHQQAVRMLCMAVGHENCVLRGALPAGPDRSSPCFQLSP